MEIINLGGTDKRLYELVAPLVMNPAVIRQNNNYPFKTLSKYIWYLAIDNDGVVGFIPLKPAKNGYCIDNYYVKGDDKEIIGTLLDNIITDLCGSFVLTAVVHKRHVKDFIENGFITFLELKNYHKMEYTGER
ncbi:MAG: hypothetical protein IKC70_03600 [Bacteroidaceae bacterium]|nr:hypothetical protein [Bacteroidaceae bacterium]